jgi:REG-2-like HAD superfamily hydrolase
MTVRLPRPIFFAEAFKKAYVSQDELHPCFGATTDMTSEDWWYDVIKNTYLKTPHMTQVAPEELDRLMPEIFDLLYNEVFGTQEGWIVKEDVHHTLKKLREWRDLGNGPKIGVISNFDDRLPQILEALKLSQYFDVIVTSHGVKSAKPDRAIYDHAMKAAGVTDASACYHIGDKESTDVAGALNAGWRPVRFNEEFDEDLPDWEVVETPDVEDLPGHVEERESVLKWGRKNAKTGRSWTEIWGLDDTLTLFGLPDDEEKLARSNH